MTDSVFSDDHSAEERDYYGELVGEGKKYKTNEDLAKSKVHADEHIARLEKELAEARERDETTAKLQTLVDQIREARESQEEPSTSIIEDAPRVERDELEEIVKKVVTQQEQDRTAQQNVEKLRSDLSRLFGDNYRDKIREELQKAGITEQDFDSIARKSPSAALRVIGREPDAPAPRQTPTPPTGVNTDSFSPGQQTERTASYYRKMRKENPKLEHDRDLAIQEYNDALRLGDKFFD